LLSGRKKHRSPAHSLGHDQEIFQHGIGDLIAEFDLMDKGIGPSFIGKASSAISKLGGGFGQSSSQRGE
jgi:hypothetical protein